ncbi:MAG: hypothetical protein KGL53_13295, partial [Elusimicrobia bacterium]|nr:hypothetical protein [Elusimicrobiota bacterium]
GRLGQALASYEEALVGVQGDDDADLRLRRKVIKAVTSAGAQPPVPEEARRHAVRAQVLTRTEKEAGFAPAAAELEQAVLLAPWWGDGYYNLGLMQEGAKDYAGAARSLRLCLLASPDSPNASEVQNKVYELEVLQEEADKVRGLAGAWANPKSGVKYEVTMDGDRLTARSSSGLVIRAVKSGSAFDGTVTAPAVKAWTNNDCWTPEYTVPISGKLAPDGRSITFNYMENRYSSSYWHLSGSGTNNTGRRQGECVSVTLQGTSPEEFTIAR